MNIILLERIEKLGQIGDLVTVKSGYARNFLLPQGKAVFASKENIKLFENQKISFLNSQKYFSGILKFVIFAWI